MQSFVRGDVAGIVMLQSPRHPCSGWVELGETEMKQALANLVE